MRAVHVIKIKYLKDLLSNGLLFTCLFCITRNFPFKELSFLVTASLFCLFMVSAKDIAVNIKSSKKYLQDIYLINIFFLLVMLVYSVVVMQNEVNLAIRFFVIFSIILTAYFYRPNKTFIDIFILMAVFHAIVLILLELYMVLFANAEIYAFTRQYFHESGYGDLYTFNGIFYRIQIIGNSVVPVSLYISIVYLRKSFMKLAVVIILLAGTVIAGNFAFWIATGFFMYMYLVINIKLKYSNIIVGTVLMSLLLVGGYMISKDYVAMVLERKHDSSLGARSDQAIVLMDDLCDNSFTLLFGKGLGHTITKESAFRVFTGAFYYELQTLYLLNQAGVLYFTIFIISNLIFALNFIGNKKLLLIYSSYVVYAITNPYIFDSVHVLLIVVLVSLRKEIKSHEYPSIVRHKPDYAFDQVPAVLPS